MTASTNGWMRAEKRQNIQARATTNKREASSLVFPDQRTSRPSGCAAA